MNAEDSLMETLSEAIYQLDNGGFDPDRPFDGQPQTDDGERGKTECRLRFRDVADCIAIAFLYACGFSEERVRASTRNDIYDAIDADPDFDPGAVIQNATCEMERRMGIYPNVPRLSVDESEPESEGVVVCDGCGAEAYSMATGEKIARGPDKWRCDGCEGVVVEIRCHGEMLRPVLPDLYIYQIETSKPLLGVNGVGESAPCRLTRIHECEQPAYDSADDPGLNDALEVQAEAREELDE